MVLMHMMHKDNPEGLIVAHFDHGIRQNSADDYNFVEREAKKLGLKFIGTHAKLGVNCSEEKARMARYEFLRTCARNNNAKIYTAHHSDDIVESIIINILRGTGWRGLSPMRSSDIGRPLSNLSKADIYRYAAKNQIVFRQDQTNNDEKYLRNRIREWLISLGTEKSTDLKLKLFEKYITQRNLAIEIDEILAEIKQKPNYSRKFFKNLDRRTATEILRHILRFYDISLTRPQLSRVLDAICTFPTNSRFSLNGSNFMYFSRHTFSVESVKN